MKIKLCSYGDLLVYTYICDDCGIEVEFEGATFNEMDEFAKEDGWVFYKNGNEWNHFCSQSCKENLIGE